MNLLLDSNRYSDFVAGDPGTVTQLQLAAEIVIPTIVLGELRAGFLSGSRPAHNESTLVNFLRGPRVTVADVDQATTHVYASSAHLTVVTCDVDDHARVVGLRVENWT